MASTNSPILSLPAELLDRVFSYLAPCRQDISYCRLVNGEFKDLSSPYLITRVVFAHRLDTLQRLLDIVEHPYFKLHVTELWYDASLYVQRCANNLNAYIMAREESDDYAGVQQWVEEQAWPYRNVWERVFSSQTSDTPAFTRPYNESTASDDSWHFPHYVRQGYADYLQRYDEQERLKDDKLPEVLLAKTFLQLPKLQHLILGDYRMLGSDPYDFGDCCRAVDMRDMLEPDWVGRTGHLMTYETLDVILKAARQTGTTFKTFSIATNPYTAPVTLDLQLGLEDLCRDFYFGEISLSEHPNFKIPLEVKDTFSPLKNLRRLCLTATFNEGMYNRRYPDAEVKFDGNVMPSLLHISASSLDLAELTHSSLACKPGECQGWLSDVFTDIELPALRHLALFQWEFAVEEMKKLLSKFCATLRELRLVHNRIYGDAKDLALWGGSSLSLAGVESHNFHEDTNEVIEGYHSLWLSDRRNLLTLNVQRGQYPHYSGIEDE